MAETLFTLLTNLTIKIDLLERVCLDDAVPGDTFADIEMLGH